MTDEPRRTLKVLIALQYYLPHRTGLTLHVQRLAEGLARRGHHVTVLCARHDMRAPRDEEVVNGVRVVRLWAPIRVTRGCIMPAYPWASFMLVKQSDVVSIHTPMLETPVFAAWTKLLRKGLVVTHHGDLTLPAGFFSTFVQETTYGIHRFTAGAAHRFIAYSQDYLDHSRWLAPFKDRATPIYPPIEIPTPRPERVAELRREWLGPDAPPGALIVGYAGRFVQEKRPDVLIRAMDTVRAERPGSVAVFSGRYDLSYEHTFSDHKALIEARKDHLHFLGLLEDPQDVADFYAACDVLSLPSDTECFALVQVEAMLCGTPVVASDIPGAREVVKVSGMGLHAPAGDPDGHARALLQVGGDLGRYTKPKEEIDAIFSLERTLDAYEQELTLAADRIRTDRSS